MDVDGTKISSLKRDINEIKNFVPVLTTTLQRISAEKKELEKELATATASVVAPPAATVPVATTQMTTTQTANTNPSTLLGGPEILPTQAIQERSNDDQNESKLLN